MRNSIKKNITILFQIILVIIAICVFVFMLWEPHLEGRNVGATLWEIYFNDPFLACAYVASIAFFVGVYKAFKILGYVRKNKLASPETMKALRTIKYCAMTITGFVIARRVYIFTVVRGSDDIAGGVAISGFIALVCIFVLIMTYVLEKKLRRK